jgi:DoxX
MKMKAACKWAQQYGPLLGRLLLANLFIVSGFKKIGGFAGTAGYMAAKMPALDPGLINVMLALSVPCLLGTAARPDAGPIHPVPEKHGHHGRTAADRGAGDGPLQPGERQLLAGLAQIKGDG